MAYAAELPADRRGDAVLERFRGYEVSPEAFAALEEAAGCANAMIEAQLHAIALMNSVYPVPEIPALADLTAALPELTEGEAGLTGAERVSCARILVLGHSLGGNAVPAIARELEKAPVKACGFIMMAASPRPLDVLMREQYDFLYSLAPEVTAEQQAEKDAIFAELDKLKDLDALSEDDTIVGVYSSYWKWLADYDILQAAGEITEPVLLLQGEEDYQVTMEDFGIWKDKALKEKLEAELSLDVVIENNVKAFALGELIYGEIKNPESVLFLKWGPGIGSAIIANGKIYTGNDSSVAEIGHYIVNAGGVKCRCGRFGCLETEASEKVILSELNTKQTLDEVLKNCDNDTMNIIAHKIDMVALALTNTATILNTDNIVLFGTMFNNEIIAEKLKRQCLRYNSNFKEETIRLSSLNSNSGYIGACAVCAKELFFEKAV